MKHSGKLVLCLAGGLFLHAQARAVGSEGNPYANIVDRNVFGLRPPPPPPEPPKPEVKASPITLQGIISAFGKKQVLFKSTVSARSGEPAKETSFVMSEGERVGEIEVLEINEGTGLVKFRNQGFEMTKDLSKDGVKPPTGGGAPPPGLPGVPGVPGQPNAAVPPPLPTGAPNVAIPNRQMRMSPANAAAQGGTPVIAGGAAGVRAQAGAAGGEQPLTADQQTVLIELNRRMNEDKIKRGDMPPLPPTELTPPPQ
jgi:hypothetical protein